MADLFCRLKEDASAEEGQALAEYALILTMVLVIGLPALSALGVKLIQVYMYIGQTFASLMR